MSQDPHAPALARLPLRPAQLAVLASLANGPAAGIAILEHVERVGSGAAVLGPGTLYRLLRELAAEALIAHAPAPANRDQRIGQRPDDRRQNYALTALGRAVLEAEAERLRRTLAEAGLLPAGPGA